MKAKLISHFNKIGTRFFQAEISQKQLLPKINKIGIVGTGQMGTGIAIVAALKAKANVIAVDSDFNQINASKKFVSEYLSREMDKKRISKEELDQTMSRIQTSIDLQHLSDCQFVIEASNENVRIKREIFSSLDQIFGNRNKSHQHQEVILATNTSSISITKIASATNCPERVIGMHFMYPVPKMKLVEVITGLATSESTLNTTLELARCMNKTTTISKDRPGFIANRVLMPYINEAILTYQDGIATREHIDTTMKLGTAVPMGPLELADFIGLDTCLAIMQVLCREFSDSKYRPAPLLVSYVDAGQLGRKSGKGFYDYTRSKASGKKSSTKN